MAALALFVFPLLLLSTVARAQLCRRLPPVTADPPEGCRYKYVWDANGCIQQHKLCDPNRSPPMDVCPPWPPMARPPEGCDYNIRKDSNGCLESYRLECGPCYICTQKADGSAGECRQARDTRCSSQFGARVFSTMQQCTTQCLPTARSQKVTFNSFQPADSPNVCEEPRVTGSCKAYFRRYYYDKRADECRRFVYGGCGGNGNRFRRKHQCERTCLKQSVNNVDKQSPVVGRKGDTSQPVDEASVCEEPRVTGPCRALFRMFYYNKDANECQMFGYGGCRGNGNRFRRKEECEATCLKEPDEERSRKQSSSNVPTSGSDIRAECTEPPETGVCRALFRRYYYDPSTSKCRVFFYGGCGGNSNNFKTTDQCMSACAATAVEQKNAQMNICYLDKKVGPCEALIPRWYYNRSIRRCEKFDYGGCEGNQNNFASEEACFQRCPPGQ